MINLNEKLLDLQAEIGPEAFCILLQIARHNGKEGISRPGNYKLSTLTGLSERKVTQATNRLQEMSLIKKEQIFISKELQEKQPALKARKIGSFFTNKYKITTSFIAKYVNCMDSVGYDFSDEEGKVDDSHFDDNVTDDSVKSTNKVLMSSEVLSSSSTSTKIPDPDFENFDLDENRKTIILMKGVEKDIYELELANWKDYIRGMQTKPQNLSSSLTNWLLNVANRTSKLKYEKEKIEKSAELAGQRVQEYHQKKMENIAKIGTGFDKNKKSSNFSKKPEKLIYASEYEYKQDYEDACTQAISEGFHIIEIYNPLYDKFKAYNREELQPTQTQYDYN